jgi:WD40 repeat protein
MFLLKLLCTWRDRAPKRHLLGAMPAAILMTAFVPCVNADLYVSSSNGNSVLRYDEVTGAFIEAFIAARSGSLSSPRGLLFGPQGNLYVNSFDTNSVMRYDGTTGAPLPSPGHGGAFFVANGSGGLQGAAGLILGQDGNLYLSSRTNNEVLRFSATTGDFIDKFVPAGLGGLDFPTGLVFGPDGNLYVSCYNRNTVMRYDGSTGAPLPGLGQAEAIFASSGLQGATGLAFGPDGNLYVGSWENNCVVRFHGETGEFMDTFVCPGSGGLSGSSALVFGPDGNLYVSSQSNNSVLRYDGTTGAFIDVFIPAGSGGLNFHTYLIFTNTDPTTLAYAPPPRSQFLITAPMAAVSGTPFDITVTALDSSGNIDTAYQGTVTFSTTDPDPGVVLPADYTFTTGDGSDNGVHAFPAGVTLVTLGDQTLTVTDNVSGLTGTINIAVGPGP